MVFMGRGSALLALSAMCLGFSQARSRRLWRSRSCLTILDVYIIDARELLRIPHNVHQITSHPILQSTHPTHTRGAFPECHITDKKGQAEDFPY